ncbi:hypothetical protein D3C76_1047340 [compost metagenome]
MTLDAHGQSVLRCAAQAVELGIGKALATGSASVRIRHCHNRLLLLGYLGRCNEQGLNFCVHWRDARQQWLATFGAGQSSPSLQVHDLEQPAQADEQSVNVLMSRHFNLLPAANGPDAKPQVNLGWQDLAGTAEHQRRTGLAVEDAVWATLKKLGERVLVESTEESRRRGAGEGSDAT